MAMLCYAHSLVFACQGLTAGSASAERNLAVSLSRCRHARNSTTVVCSAASCRVLAFTCKAMTCYGHLIYHFGVLQCQDPLSIPCLHEI